MAVTLKELIDRALRFADHPKDGMDETEKATLIADINDGVRELWALLVDAHQVYAEKKYDFTIVSGTEDYDLPADFLRAQKLWFMASGRRYKMKRYQIDEIDGYPKPISGGQIELWYVPRVAKLKNSKDTLSAAIPEDYENYPAYVAACRLLALEEDEGLGAAAQERDRIRGLLINLAGERDEGDPTPIGDFYGRWDRAFIMRDFLMRELRYRITGNKINFIEVQLSGV
jgi:hypothetical protein